MSTVGELRDKLTASRISATDQQRVFQLLLTPDALKTGEDFAFMATILLAIKTLERNRQIESDMWIRLKRAGVANTEISTAIGLMGKPVPELNQEELHFLVGVSQQLHRHEKQVRNGLRMLVVAVLALVAFCLFANRLR